MELLGLFWIVLFFGTPFAVGAYIAHRRGGVAGAEHRRRARLIEMHTRNAVHDAEVMNDVLTRLAEERRTYRRR